MLSKAKLVAFAATADAARARAFYEGTLGLPVIDESPFALVVEASGTTIRIQKVEKVHAAPYTTLGWEVPDIAAAVKVLASRGVVFKRYPGMDQDELGIWRSPSGTRVAWLADPDGNVLSLSQ
jgi:catechol 2,3-dioxygenase-like lactoylglutathione lyase family enzyme